MCTVHKMCKVHIVTLSTTRTGPLVFTLACAGIMVSAMQTLVVPLIGELPRLLHTSASNGFWAITATLLAGAVTTPVFGRLGDMYGKRRMLLFALGVLILGSIVCALSASLIPIVVGRTLQGCAFCVIPLGISIMRDELPPEKMGSAMALMSSSLGVGGALGLPAAAAVAQHTDWHMLFWGSAVLGMIIFVLVVTLVPESPVRSGGRFDLVGAVGLSAGLICLLLGISKGGDWGWSSGTVLGLLGAAAVVFLLWGRWELRATGPLVDLRTTTQRQVLVTNLVSVVVGFAMYAMSLVIPLLLQLPKSTGYGLGQSMVAAGLWLAPGGIVMMLVSPLSARLSRARGPKISLLVGAAVISAGYWLGLVMMDTPWQVCLIGILIAVGIAFSYAAMPALIMSAVPLSETAAANGLNSLMRSIGTSLSSAVIGVVLAHMTTSLGTPSLNGFRTAFVIGGGTALLALCAGLLIPGRTPDPAHDPAELAVSRT
jgi:MFS family permease